MKYKLRYISVIFLTLLVLTCRSNPSVNNAAIGKPSELVPLTSRALTGTLPNGLKYYILENSLPENRAHLALVVNAGSVLERDDERGLAHFVEHLAFNDTARFPQLELIDYLRSLGMRFGADVNAYTSYNETVYHFDVPVEVSNGVKRIPDRALAILDDWSYAVSFKPEDVESEKLVILEETRARLGAGERVRRITLPIIFSGSAYANREPIGLSSIIEGATPRQLKDFYDRWYTSDNMAVVFVGDFDGRTLEAELANHFNMPAASQPVNRPSFRLPAPNKKNFQVEIITDPELTSLDYSIYLKQKRGAQRGTVAYYRESVLDYLISTMINMRFEEKVTDPQAAATESWAGPWQWSDNTRFYLMGTTPKTENAEQALRELLLEIETARRHGFTQNELERAKLILLSYMERQFSERDRRESRFYINGFTSHFLTGEDMADIEWEVNAINSMLPSIRLKEINKEFKNYFAANDRIVFLLSPEAEKQNLPSADRIRAIFREVEKAKIPKRKEAAVSRELLNTVPSAGSIVSQEIDRETEAVILTLSNGAKVILKETANRNNEVVLYAMAKGGTANASQEASVSVSFASEMLSVSGAGPYSRTELINILAGKQASLSFWTSSFYRGFQGASTTSDLKTLFELIYLSFTSPRLDERAIAAMLDQYRTGLVHQLEDPQRFFSNEITRTINNNHPLFMPLELADMDKVSIEQAAEFIELCKNPSDYTFVFTGNLDPRIIEYISTYIASVPNAPSMNQWIDPRITRPGNIERKIYKGADERCMVYLSWFADAPSVFDEKINQVSAVLSEYLDILLIDEIREKLGGVYSISAGASVSVIPNGEYRLSVFFQCNPARAEELITAVIDHITGVFNQPLNMDTFNKSKEALLMQHESSMQRNLHIAQSYANSQALYSTPLARLNQRPDVVRSVTPQEVQSLCSQMLVNGPVRIVMYPDGWE